MQLDGPVEGWLAPSWAPHPEGNALITIADDGSVSTSSPATTAVATPEQANADVSAGQKMTFHFTEPDASRVYLAADFNTWAENKDGVVSSRKRR